MKKIKTLIKPNVLKGLIAMRDCRFPRRRNESYQVTNVQAQRPQVGRRHPSARWRLLFSLSLKPEGKNSSLAGDNL